MRSRQRLLCHRQFVAVAFTAIILSALPAGAAKKKAEAPAPPPPAPPGAAGAFKDRDGARHEWLVNGSFALLWEGAPYLPVGVVLKPRSLAEPDKADAWEADRQALAAWKQAGITDVVVQPGRPAVTIPTAAWQRLIDGLEAEGFSYGVALPAAPPRPSRAYYVRAGSLRLGPFQEKGERALDIRIPGLEGAKIERVAAAIIGQRSGRLIRLDWARLENAGDRLRAVVDVDPAPRDEDYSIELMPLVAGVPGVPDLWEGFGDVRDALLPLANLKFGKGLRFLVHPLAGAINLEGANAYMLPASDAYRVEFEAFLTRKYRKIEALRGQWSFRGDLPPDFQTAARLVPVAVCMAAGQAAGYLLDEKQARCYALEPGASRFWYDHLYFREHSLREQVNLLAQFLGEQVADVPVVFPRSGSMRYYHVNDRASGGFAGVGLTATPDTLVREGGTAIGEARMAANRPWCVALSLEGFDTRERLSSGIECLRRAGVKGWFVDPPAAASANTPAWLSACRQELATRADAADYQPGYLLYPHAIRETGGFGHQQEAVGAEPQPLGEHLWWIPAISSWDPMDLGPDIKGYGMRDGATYRILMWSPGGKRRIHLVARTYEEVEVQSLEGKVVSKRKKGKPLAVDLSERPVVITGLNPLQATPVEVAKAELDELERLSRELGLKGRSVRELQGMISLARTLNPEADPRGVRQLIQEPLMAARRLNQAAAPAGSGVQAPAP